MREPQSAFLDADKTTRDGDRGGSARRKDLAGRPSEMAGCKSQSKYLAGRLLWNISPAVARFLAPFVERRKTASSGTSILAWIQIGLQSLSLFEKKA